MGRQLTRGDLATDHHSVFHFSVGPKFAWSQNLSFPTVAFNCLSTNRPLKSLTLETLRTILVILKLYPQDSIIRISNRTYFNILCNESQHQSQQGFNAQKLQIPFPCLVTTQWCTQRGIVLEEIADPKDQTQPLIVHARTAISYDLEHIGAWDAAAAHPGWIKTSEVWQVGGVRM